MHGAMQAAVKMWHIRYFFIPLFFAPNEPSTVLANEKETEPSHVTDALGGEDTAQMS